MRPGSEAGDGRPWGQRAGHAQLADTLFVVRPEQGMRATDGGRKKDGVMTECVRDDGVREGVIRPSVSEMCDSTPNPDAHFVRSIVVPVRAMNDGARARRGTAGASSEGVVRAGALVRRVVVVTYIQLRYRCQVTYTCEKRNEVQRRWY